MQGRNRHIFLRGQSHFSWFFPGTKCFFPVENSHFGRPKINFIRFEKWKAKKKKSPHLFLLLFLLPFSIFHLPFFNFPFFFCSIFPIFFASLFAVRQQKFPGQKSLEGTLPSRLLPHCINAILQLLCVHASTSFFFSHLNTLCGIMVLVKHLYTKSIKNKITLEWKITWFEWSHALHRHFTHNALAIVNQCFMIARASWGCTPPKNAQNYAVLAFVLQNFIWKLYNIHTTFWCIDWQKGIIIIIIVCLFIF